MVGELRAEITKEDAEVKQTLAEQGDKIRELVGTTKTQRLGLESKQTPQKQITDEVHDILVSLQLSGYTDNPAWTTGPCRSMCLLNFKVRGDEGYQGMRPKIQQVLDRVMRASVIYEVVRSYGAAQRRESQKGS